MQRSHWITLGCNAFEKQNACAIDRLIKIALEWWLTINLTHQPD